MQPAGLILALDLDRYKSVATRGRLPNGLTVDSAPQRQGLAELRTLQSRHAALVYSRA
jgi:hypothetical protein